MKLIILILLFPIVVNVESQSLKMPISSRHTGLGAYSKNFTDVFSFTANQAALVEAKRLEVGIYCEKRFLLAATNLYTAVLITPLAANKQGCIGIAAGYFGFANYNESELGLAYAKSLGKINLGIKFNYFNLRIPGYGSSSTLDFELGGIVRLTQKVFAGLEIYNPVGGRLNKTNDKIRSAYKYGMGYEASENFFIGMEIIKEEDVPININTGIQYNWMKQFYFRLGVATETASSYIGSGFSLKSLQFEIMGSYHPQLGFSPGLMLIFHPGVKE